MLVLTGCYLSCSQKLYPVHKCWDGHTQKKRRKLLLLFLFEILSFTKFLVSMCIDDAEAVWILIF